MLEISLYAHILSTTGDALKRTNMCLDSNKMCQGRTRYYLVQANGQLGEKEMPSMKTCHCMVHVLNHAMKHAKHEPCSARNNTPAKFDGGESNVTWGSISQAVWSPLISSILFPSWHFDSIPSFGKTGTQ
jgi:hypothetical protein